MNLCGGIVNVAEPELLKLEIPDEHFSLTPRRKASSSAPSRRKKGVPTYIDTGRRTPTGTKTSASSRPSSRGRSRQSPSSLPPSPAGPSPTFLNPISRQDMKKSRSRQRPQGGPPMHGLKTTSGLIKKLETGFNVTLLSDSVGRSVLLDLDPDKAHLRVQTPENNSDNENDGSKSNHTEIRLRLKDITRLEVGRGKHLKTKNSESPKPSRCFSVVMRKATTSDSNTFNFEADTQVERDLVIASIKGILEQSKSVSENRRRKSQSPIVDGMRRADRSNHENGSTERSESSSETQKGGSTETQKYVQKVEVIETPKVTGQDEGLENGVVYFDFDFKDGSDGAIAAGIQREKFLADGSEDRNDSSNSARDTHSMRDGSEGRVVADTDANPAKPPDKYSSKDATLDEQAVTSIKQESRALSITVVDGGGLKDVAVEVIGKEWSVDDIMCGVNAGRGRRKKERPGRRETRTSKGKVRAIEEMKHNIVYESIGCQALGCQSEALAAVEDVELAHMANQVTGPWCTDDVCSANLKDFADTMKGIFDVKQHVPDDEQQRTMAENYITGVLGAPPTMANLISVKDIWKTTTKGSQPEKRRQKSVQNRAAKADAQAKRLNRLRNQMTFTAAEANEKMPFVQIINSFDDIGRGGRFARKVSSSSELTELGEKTESVGFLDVVAGNTAPEEDSESNVHYYDSDPEDYRERTLRRGPRRIAAERKNKKETKPLRKEALSSISTTRIGMNRRWKRLDEEVMSEIIETMKNEKMPLMWHPAQTKTNPNRVPICVNVWIESGVYLIDGTFLLPKLTWMPVYEKSLQSKVLNISQQKPETLDLLDVCRVRECESVDRDVYPFAQAECSFIIQTQKGVHWFEAQSKQERGRIVNGLRLVIARLASLLMLRDLRAVDEFFSGNAVPGEAPDWAKNEHNPNAIDAPADFPSNTN